MHESEIRSSLSQQRSNLDRRGFPLSSLAQKQYIGYLGNAEAKHYLVALPRPMRDKPILHQVIIDPKIAKIKLQPESSRVHTPHDPGLGG